VGVDDRREREAVDVVDLTRLERLSGLDDLVARRQNRDAGPREDFDVGDAAGCQRADAARVEHDAGFDHRLTGGDVGGSPSDVLSRVDRRQHSDGAVAGLLGHFHHYDGVRAARQRRAGRDLHARAARDPLRRHLTRVCRADDAQRLRICRARAERVVGHDRVAVHGRAIERRHV
jgi:hypothetical protein